MKNSILILLISLIFTSCDQQEIAKSSPISSKKVSKKKSIRLIKSKLTNIDRLIGKYIQEDNDQISLTIGHQSIVKAVSCSLSDNSFVLEESRVKVGFFNNNLMIVSKGNINKSNKECISSIHKGTYKYNLDGDYLEMKHNRTSKIFRFKRVRDLSKSLDEKIKEELEKGIDDSVDEEIEFSSENDEFESEDFV